MTGSQLQSAEPVRRVAVVSHGKPELVEEARARLESLASDAGVEIVEDGAAAPDLVVVLGGDGTMLRALQRYLGTGVPVLGVNFGRVGFLTSMNGSELETGLARAFAGEYAVLELATLDVEAARQASRRRERRRGRERRARPHGGARVADRRRGPRLGGV